MGGFELCRRLLRLQGDGYLREAVENRARPVFSVDATGGGGESVVKFELRRDGLGVRVVRPSGPGVIVFRAHRRGWRVFRDGDELGNLVKLPRGQVMADVVLGVHLGQVNLWSDFEAAKSDLLQVLAGKP